MRWSTNHTYSYIYLTNGNVMQVVNYGWEWPSHCEWSVPGTIED